MRIALDLGTSYFRAGVCGRTEIISEPCVIAYDQNGEAIIGTEAARMVGRNPDMVSIHRPIEWGAINDFGAVVQMIRHVFKTLTPTGFGRRYSLTIGVPSGLTQVERKAVQEAGKTAGAREVQLVNATVAAALGAKLPIESPVGCLVVNLGAGVTEAAILSMRGVVDSRSLNTGGRSIDQAIVDTIKREYMFLVGQLSAEDLKRRCGENDGTNTLEIKGRNLNTGLPDSLNVPRTIADDQLEVYCATIVELIVQTLSACPPELVGDIMERGIVLVGGGANIKSLVRRLTVHTDVPIIVAEEPETSVIRGLLGYDQAKTDQAIWNNILQTPSALKGKSVSGLYKRIMGGNAQGE